MKFGKVLVANRGEIAVRVIRTCRRMGLRTVAVHSEADRESLHVGLAEEAVCIGPARAARSYLDAQAVLAAAHVTGAQAIHPGYGFLSENADFAQACADRGLTFIGPPAAAIRRLGNKAAAKALARECRVPVVPGGAGCVGADFAREAESIGFPLMVKAASGGGGRGLRLVRAPEELERALHAAQNEARAAFGDDSVYIEKFIERPRHVEVQILADSHGLCVALPERDCSIQRRHQKLAEETPCPSVAPDLRLRMQETAVRLARAADYRNAGTVEFLLDSQGRFYFIEVNARLQVEHPVTECVTGLDLVEEQLRIAMGLPLGFDPESARRPLGHSVECRINAEDPERAFAPCPGTVLGLRLPGGPGVRVDTHLVSGYTVPSHYDSLLAKLVVWGPDRGSALARMKAALGEFRVEGLATTIPWHLKLLSHPGFLAGEADTGLAERLLSQEEPSHAASRA